MEKVEAGIGRYLPGWRHYENFNNYNLMYPGSTIEEYRSEMYRQVELAEYISITRSATLEEINQPDFMLRNRLEGEDEKLPPQHVATPEAVAAEEPHHHAHAIEADSNVAHRVPPEADRQND